MTRQGSHQRRSATRNLVIGLGVLILCLDLIQDINQVYLYVTVKGWTNAITGELLSSVGLNLMLFFGLGLVFFRRSSGWTLLSLLAVLMLLKRGWWFWEHKGAGFDSLASPEFLGAFSSADLLFRLLCLTVLVDLVRENRGRLDDDEPPPKDD